MPIDLAGCRREEIAARLSTREAYVGMPVVLQIQIANASDFDMPEAFEIDGCDVRSAGSPSQSSQITIVNGRRSENRSVTLQFLITPRRPGRFEIPELPIKVDGRTRMTRPIAFVATKSETGDLLFVEIEGSQDQVYVGQPLDLKLKLWVKPFRDRKNDIQLNESQMWQMISEQSAWGSFSDRIQELADNRQRPRGKEVLRDDGSGNQRAYFLYEIDATVYPTRPGRIDASDVQVVVNYPTALGRSRNPFDSFFDDDFFGASPFGRRLTISQTRPIAAEAIVDSTKVLPVPMNGRPADYRGAVGRYRIVTESEPNSIDAGDPMTLRIGVMGDGPMELVQAPPLHEIESLTEAFKVTDHSLAGFVQDNTKVFVTTIRPRRAGITEIPPIPFSFFDPEKEEYETVYSEPIPISVHESEQLSMDSIVSRTGPNGGSTASRGSQSAAPDCTNEFSMDVLETTTSANNANWWLYFAIVPPGIWLVVVFGRLSVWAYSGMPQFGSAKSIAIRRIETARVESEIATAIADFVAFKTGLPIESQRQAVGTLRRIGLPGEASQVESFFDHLDRRKTDTLTTSTASESASVVARNNRSSRTTIDSSVSRAMSLLGTLDVAITAISKRNIRRSPKPMNRGLWRRSRRAIVGGFLVFLALTGQSHAQASTAGVAGSQLSKSQMQTIFEDANLAYQQAEAIVSTDQAEALERFADASQKYQLLVDQGVRSSRLFLNLANAYLRSGEWGRAICNYYRVLKLDPRNSQATLNLHFAQDRLERRSDSDSSANAKADIERSKFYVRPLGLSNLLAGSTSRFWLQVLFAIASTTFWCLMVLGTLQVRIPSMRLAVVPPMFLLVCGIFLSLTGAERASVAIIVTDDVQLRAGDGREFAEVAKLDSAEGREATITDHRNDWVKLTFSSGESGWLHASQIEPVDLPL